VGLTDRSSGFFEHEGKCPVCDSTLGFRAHGLPLRNSFLCLNCSSSPRERAIIETINIFYPNWRDLTIHESSPGSMGSSKKLQAECRNYIASQYDTSIPFGTSKNGYVSQDLENQTFEDESFDIVITQDVFEHIFRPDLAIKEICRTLRVGGAHICTVPMVMREAPSLRRAEKIGDDVRYIYPAEYHKNPIDETGSLVTVDWGFDIAGYFSCHGPLVTTIVHIDDLEKGIRAEINEVLVCRKLPIPNI